MGSSVCETPRCVSFLDNTGAGCPDGETGLF